MKQITACTLSLCLMLSGCSATRAAPFGKLSGTNDIVLVENLLFIVSTTTDELRVLDVASTTPDFLRGPNPLEPLTIPVLDQPKSVFRDWRFDGRETGESYVYVGSPGANEVSIVSVAAKREMIRLKTGAPVTTLAAASVAVSGSILWVATFDGISATIQRILIPSGDEVYGLSSDSLETVFSFDQEAVVAMQPLPNGELAVATRSQSGKGGRTFVLNPASPLAEPRLMQFPAPVSFLTTYAVGTRLFGLLDEGSCSDNSCRGVLAVEVSTGERSLDVRGAPMLPIRMGTALFRGLAVAANMTGPGDVKQQVLGAATTSQGELLYFDAGALRYIDANSSGPSVISTVFRNAPGPNEAEGLVTTSIVGGPVEVQLTDGATRQETVTVTFQGAIPGLQKLPVGTSNGLQFVLPAAYAERTQVGDFLLVETNGVICSETLVSATGNDVVESSQKVEADCLNGATFSLRAGAGLPLVVAGSETGYMGRTGIGQTFTFQGDYFQHGDMFDVLAAQPQLSFQIIALEPQMSRDSRYELSLDDGFTAHTSFPDSNRVGTRFNLPGAVELDAVRQRAYVAYPSADAVALSQPSITPVGVNGSIEVRR